MISENFIDKCHQIRSSPVDAQSASQQLPDYGGLLAESAPGKFATQVSGHTLEFTFRLSNQHCYSSLGVRLLMVNDMDNDEFDSSES